MTGENKCLNYKRRIRLSSLSTVINYYHFLIVCTLIFTLATTFVSATLSFKEANNRVENDLKDDRPCNFLLDYNDAHLTTPEIIAKYGYPVERHWVTTEDGYILEVHRIPKKQSTITQDRSNFQNANDTSTPATTKSFGNGGSVPAPAVFLQHGLIGSSRNFVLNCEKRALAFELWDNGYDVWLGNIRGNTYSLNHTSLSTNSPEFWDFSVDQVGYYDVPASIDYILNTTGLKKVSIVAHSMGNAVTLIMLTGKPEYNDKVDIWFAMSGAVTVQGMASPVIRLFTSFPRTIQWLLTRYNKGQLFSQSLIKMFNKYLPMICNRGGRRGDPHGFCSTFYFINDGYDPGQIPPEIWTVAVGNTPASTSVKFVVQWMQWIISGDFAMYDDGPIKNLRKYGTVTPKKYPLEFLNIPTVLMWGQNDWVVAASDIHKQEAIASRISRKLRHYWHPHESFKIASPHWNHVDFIFGKDADIFVYKHILARLAKVYRNHQNNYLIQENQNNSIKIGINTTESSQDSNIEDVTATTEDYDSTTINDINDNE